MTGYWGEDYWGPHTPGLDCPCGPGHVEVDIPAWHPTYGAYTQTIVFGIWHRGITEEISRHERPNATEDAA
jgi:hypothetical protein